MTTTTNQITTIISPFAPIRLRILLDSSKFATLRISKDGKSIRDGRVYKTENSMRGNRASRPTEAKMFAVEYVGNRFFKLTEII
jgi:hypothetical protein